MGNKRANKGTLEGMEEMRKRRFVKEVVKLLISDFKRWSIESDGYKKTGYYCILMHLENGIEIYMSTKIIQIDHIILFRCERNAIRKAIDKWLEKCTQSKLGLIDI